MNNLVEKTINGQTYLVDKNGKICYIKNEEAKDFSEMNEITLQLNIKTNGEIFDGWLSDNIGGSGVLIKKSNKNDFLAALSAYIESYIN